MKVVTYFFWKEIAWVLADEDCRRLEARFPGISVVAVDDPAALAAALADAEVFLGFHLPPAAFAAATRLRWMQSATAGVEENLYPELAASDLVLTNAAGLHAVAIPEHVLGQMLVLARNLHEAVRLQGTRTWDRLRCITFGSGIRELDGGRLAILGAGPIGAGLARKASALGLRVRVLRRHATRPLDGAEAVLPPESLLDLLAWADFVVVALPLTAETRGVIGAAALAAMRPEAFLINVGRGELVDEPALVSALERGAIAGAALDAFVEEPLPAAHPFWALPNLVLTPHVSGYTPNFLGKVLNLFEDNLERYLAGRPLRNVVDKEMGYTSPD